MLGLGEYHYAVYKVDGATMNVMGRDRQVVVWVADIPYRRQIDLSRGIFLIVSPEFIL